MKRIVIALTLSPELGRTSRPLFSLPRGGQKKKWGKKNNHPIDHVNLSTHTILSLKWIKLPLRKQGAKQISTPPSLSPSTHSILVYRAEYISLRGNNNDNNNHLSFFFPGYNTTSRCTLLPSSSSSFLVWNHLSHSSTTTSKSIRHCSDIFHTMASIRLSICRNASRGEIDDTR